MGADVLDRDLVQRAVAQQAAAGFQQSLRRSLAAQVPRYRKSFLAFQGR
jgi:hypothetical protein